MALLNKTKVKNDFKKIISETEGTSLHYQYFVVVYTLIERKRNDQALAYVASLDKKIIDLFPEDVLRLIRYL